MTEIKRPNYFTSQFLVEGDFNAEQAYHLTFRRRHNRVFHTTGVADGLGITAVANAQAPAVTIAPGTAIDKDGNEIVLNDAVTYQLTTTTPNTDVFLSVKYADVLDPADKYPPAPEHFTRTTERPSFQDGATAPTDPSVAVRPRIRVYSNAQIQSGAIDSSVRTASSAKLGPGVVTTADLGDRQTTGLKIAIGTVTGAVAGTAASAGNIALGTITVGTSGGTGGASGGTPTGNIAIGTITGAAAGSAATIGNIAKGTITGGTSGGTGGASSGTATGNIAIGTITGAAAGSVATIGN